MKESKKSKKVEKPSKICYLDFDDFSESNNRLDWLWALKEHFPKFKVNVFTIPTKTTVQFLEYIETLEWINVCIHGLKHINNEDVPEKTLRDLPIFGYSKIYRAPFWQLSDEMYKKLKSCQYTIMIHPDDPREGIKYNWNTKDSPPNLDILYGHGHVQDVCDNGIVESFENIMKLPVDTEFKFYE